MRQFVLFTSLLVGCSPSIKHPTNPDAAQSPAPAAKREEPPLDVYFGNLHSHTAYSDGSGTPEEAFTYARDVAKIDFLAITEHNHLMGGEKATPAQRAALYAGPPATALVPTADRFDAPGRFVALYGQEFSSMSKGNHVNVFDVPQVIDVPNGDYPALLAWMKAHPDSTGGVPILQFNHPGLGQRPTLMVGKNTYGRDDFGDDAAWVKAMGSVTYLIEILNGDPAKGVLARRSEQIMEEHFRFYLQQGFRLTPVGNQDNHKTDWGNSTESRIGIIATELTKPALLAAMRARHVYATEDRNLKLVVKVNGHLAGDLITAEGSLDDVTITYTIHDADEPSATYTIDVFAGTVGGELASVVKTVTVLGDTPGAAPATFTGPPLRNVGDYLYLRVTQKSDGQPPDCAWVAPVWRVRPVSD